MTAGQITALVFAIILLLPGGCFLFFGIDLNIRQYGDITTRMLSLAIAAAIR
jgi:hypothetical protein